MPKVHTIPMKIVVAKSMSIHMNPPPSAKKIGKKISKIMHEGVRGKKVGRKQAVAIAFSMARKGKL